MVLCFGFCAFVDNAPVFWLLLHSTHAASKLPVFLTLPPPAPRNRVGWGKKLGVDTAGTADTNWPKEYSIPYNIKLSNKTGVVGEEESESGRGNCVHGGCCSATG